MVRVRIAPSPTGDPHVGTAYIALFNYVWAKKHGGQFILRVEDTDRTRSRPEWETMLVDSLKWLGLTWDEGPDVGGPHGPYRQSERSAIYQEHAALLMDRGSAYRCFCTAERLDTVRKEQMKAGQNPGYDGHCRNLSAADVQARLADNVPSVIRLKIDKTGSTTVVDKLRGEVHFENSQIDDQILIKSDGFPTYHLANVVDDHLMQISHVIRAEEWITSTPKHVLLYRGFGWQAPEFVHMPLLRNKDKSKISKRKNPVSLNFYRDAGYLPEVMLNYLGMMGWTMPDAREKFSVAEMVDAFTFERLHLGGPVFDIQKLAWLNGVYLRERTPKDMVQLLRERILSDGMLEKVAPLVRERIDKLEDFIAQTSFFFVGDLAYDADARAALVPKGKTAAEVAEALGEVAEAIDLLPALLAADADTLLRTLAEKKGWKPKDLFMPVRVALSGRTATPPLFESMEALGKERCRRRLRHVVSEILPKLGTA